MLGLYILIGTVVAIPAGFLAYRTWRFFKRRTNRRGADVEERPAGSFHQLGSQPQDLHQHSEHQLLSGSENNEPSLEAQPQRLQPQPLLAKPPPCRLTIGSENESSLSAQPQQPLALKHPSQPKPKCRLAMRVSNEESYRSVRNLCAEGVVYDVYGDIAFELYFNSVPVCGVKIDGVMAQPEWQATYWDRDPLKELGFQPLTLNSSDRFEWRDFHSKKKKKETPQRHFNAAHLMPSNRYN
ncbi:hypothetical protein BFJ66_g1001 [Fusarium oxysporum f. sp. cepae]|uniref:Uncharacterized protein n=1 Tax=Fusarium oxysporum f. sp. cepae TaxID=396571 RepID=A0A3L6NIR0_FUSOX|nr:hypothetical protein BFJ65_g8378 [Fusarium oxysporum f. sp. cepae]RKK34473.1 hypothetical protein BFJ67_g13751 [Fusarium oxysporum f. sp. cepae]RKK62194.1 hypothetical protein BFJ66_g1001 [Fusarium oxysporum f. sp. cepae]